MTDRPTVLCLAPGDFDFRGYCLEQLADLYDVVVIDSAPPTGRQRWYVADHEVADLTDEHSLFAAGRALAARHDLAGVVTWNEWHLLEAGLLAEDLGLPGTPPEVMLACRDKAISRTRFARHRVPSAASISAATLPEAGLAADRVGGYPVVLKPAASGGSIGVIHVARPEDLPGAFAFATAGAKQARESTAVLVEEYLDGPEVSVEVVTVGGLSTPVALTRKLLGQLPFFEETGHTVTAGDPLLRVAGPVAIAAVQALGIWDGVSHVELRITDRGPRIIEVNGRIGGDLIGHLVHLATGIQLARAAADIACGRTPDLTPTRHASAAIRILYPETSGTVTHRGLQAGFEANTPWLERAVWLCEPGDHLLLPPQGTVDTARAGYVLVTAPTAAQAEHRAQQAYDAMTVGTAPDTPTASAA